VRRLLLLGCAGISLVSLRAEAAGTLPSGGHFVGGTGGIATAGGTTTVTQSSQRGIVNWNSFSIGKGNKVQFDNGSGATLNRVTGGSLSTIAGRLTATGSVYLINPNGVVVGAGGKVVTGGSFVASTRDVTDSQFMAGGTQTFAGGSNGAVVNDGAVVSRDGNVVLIGHAVTNGGSIDAARGTAALAAGNRVMMTEAAGPGGVYVAKSKSGDTTNDGQVRAAAVALASAGGNVYALAGNRTGLISATGTKTVDGQVWLTASQGKVDVAGTVTATNADGSGGAIKAKGATFKLEDKAVLNAAGRKGRGTVETSGGAVSIGKAKVTAGKKGSWTIDPDDLTIDSAAASTIGTALNAGSNVFEVTGFSASSGAGDITVEAAITWNTTATLTLSSFHGININAAITATGNGGLVLTTNNNSGGTSDGTGTVNFTMGQGSVQFTGAGGALTIDGTAYTLVHTKADLLAVGSTGNYALATDIDVGAVAGDSAIPSFSGTFNGLGNTVSNLSIASTTPNFAVVGLFGNIAAAGKVSNLGITNAAVSIAGINALGGVLAGTSSGTVTNDYATGTISIGVGGDADSAGGLVGDVFGGSVSRSYANVAVNSFDPTAAAVIGGLVGINNALITDSYAVGTITSTASASDIGGLVGAQNPGASTIQNSYATGKLVDLGGGSNVGGVAGAANGTITNSYWDTTTTGAAVGENGAITGSTTGLTTAQLAAGLPSGFSASIWGNAGNKTTPYVGSNPGPVIRGADGSTTPTLFTLVFTPTQLQNISNNLSGAFVLANNIDMSGVSGFTPIGDGVTAFTGTFDGLGNTIFKLNINAAGTLGGLFGQIGVAGTVMNIGLMGETVTVGGGANAGGLAGLNNGTITRSYADVTISGGNAVNAGGLVGGNAGGTIDSAYSSGSVTALGNIGGLAGFNNGTISNAYSTAAAIGGTAGGASFIGGLVGNNQNAIDHVYATGAVSGGSGGSVLGGLYGLNAGSVTDGYWNVDRTGQATNGSNSGTLSNVAGLSGAQPYTASSYIGFGFTATPGLTDKWVLVSDTGTLNGSGSVMPMLAFEYSTTIVNAHQLQLVVMAQGADYTLAGNIDASATKATATTGTDVWGTAGFAPIGEGAGIYTGTFDGAGHTISGLTISTNQFFAGLFATASHASTIQNLNLTGLSVTDLRAGADTGGLVGQDTGTISGVSVAGTVIAGAGFTGGLAGENGGDISNSYAIVAVTSTGSEAGGLVGEMSAGTVSTSFAGGSVTATGGNAGGLIGDISTGSTVTDVYAVGAVTNTSSSSGNTAGGLVGINRGTVTDAYATGAVTAPNGALHGGLAGVNFATFVDSYFDIQTTGQPDNGRGMTTAQLQAGLPTFANPGNWDIIPGVSYPFLKFQFGGATPQVVAGTVYTDGGTTNAGAGVSVSGIIGSSGASVVMTSTQTGGAVTTGVNGYYYFLLAPGSVSTASDGSVLVQATYGSGGSIKGAAFADGLSATPTDLAIYGNTLHAVTPATQTAVEFANLASVETGFASIAAFTSALPNLRIDAAGAFTVNSSLSYAGGTVTLNAAGGIAENLGVGITAGTLQGSGVGGMLFDSTTNAVSHLGNITSNGDFNLVNTVALTQVAGTTVDAGTGVGAGVILINNGSASFTQSGTLKTTNTSNAAIEIDSGALSVGTITDAGGKVTLTTAGAITETGIITADTLAGTVAGNATLDKNNVVGTFAMSTSGLTPDNISFTNAGALTLSGSFANNDIAVTTTAGGITVTGTVHASGSLTLNSAATIVESGSGVVETGAAFSGRSVGGATMSAANLVDRFENFTNTGGGTVSFSNTAFAAPVGGIATDGNLTLNVAGMVINGDLTAGTVAGSTGHTLTILSSGVVTQTGGIVTAFNLKGDSVGGITLDDANRVRTFAFTNSVVGDISLKSTVALTVGRVTTTGGLSLTAGAMDLDGNVKVGGGMSVTLTSSGSITQSGGIVTAQGLQGSATGGVTLNGANKVAVLGPFSSGAGRDFAFTDARSFSTTGTINSGNDLTLTAGAGDKLTIGGALTAQAVVDLDMSGRITQLAGSVITASTLTGSSVGGATLTGANHVGDLGAFADTGAGNSTGFSFTDAQALTTAGTVQSTGPLTLTTTAGDLVLNGDVTAPGGAVTLNSAGGIRQASGLIDPGSLLVNSVGTVSLTGANTVDTVAGRVTGAGASFFFNDTANDLTVGMLGGVSGITTNGGDITLRTSTSGDLALNRAVDAGTGTATLAASGNLSIGAAGAVSAGGGATLAAQGNFSNASGANAITVGAGSRWLVYSTDPGADTDGGLRPDFMQYAATYTVGTLAGTAAATTGNGFLYSLAPTLTVTGVTKTYDGTTGFSGASYSFTGGMTGDRITLGGTPTGGFADKNAGTGIDVTLGGLTVTARHGGIAVFGYTVTPVSGATIGTINKADLSVGLTGAVTKTYDGTATATLGAGNFDLSGLAAGDHVKVSAGSASYATDDAGTGIVVTGAGYTLSGADAGNYILISSSSSAAIGKIDPKTVTAGLTGTVGKTYDGTTAATLNGGNYTLTGVIAGDTVALNDPSSGTYGATGPGSGIAVTVNGLALEGAKAGDYRLATTTVSANIGVISGSATPPLPTTPFIPVIPVLAGTPAGPAPDVHPTAIQNPKLVDVIKLSGCSGDDFVAVVPGADGHVGTVVVESNGNKTTLHSAYAGCSGSKPVVTSPQEVNRLFGGALAARPAPPVSFELYYRTGSVTLEPDALAAFDKAFAEIGQRRTVDIVVTGFTDSVGTPRGNDLLSLARAQAVTKLLEGRGLKAGSVLTVGRGERDPQVPTPPQVAEEKNRRVEITVR